MQGADETARMRAAVQALDETLRRLRLERARERVRLRHSDVFAVLAEEERDKRGRR